MNKMNKNLFRLSKITTYKPHLFMFRRAQHDKCCQPELVEGDSFEGNKKSKQVQIGKLFYGCILFFLFSFTPGNNYAQPKQNYAELVNTLIGTKGKGNDMAHRYLEAGFTFPGAMSPFGMVQFTPTFFDEDKGFVVNQLSGAGCGHMGNFPTMPLAGELEISPDDMKNLKPGYQVEKAMAGYYRVKLQSDILCELTVTQRTGMARYNYPENKKTATVIIGSGINATQLTSSNIKITSPNSCEGFADGGSFCGPNIKTGYKIYFVAEFNQPAFKTGTWKNDKIQPDVAEVSDENSGAFFTFSLNGNHQLQYKFAISYVSIENARENLKAENPDWNFDKISNQTITAWNDYLGRIQVSGGTTGHTIQFYTHLYHALAHPNICNDVNGEYMGSDNQVHRIAIGHHYYTSLSNWDTYRTQIQLLSLIAPNETADIINSIILFAQNSGGGFPRWVMANIETGIMQGDPTSILVSNAYAFGVHNFDTQSALAIMRKGAEEPGTKSQQELTRPNLEQYLSKGYINASMCLEYTSADFAIAQFAKQAFNDNELFEKYLKRSQYWKNLYNPSTNWLNSRNADGSWKRYDEDWREASYKNYFWMVPYNLGGLIKTMGGKLAAEKRLDSFFSKLNASYNEEWFAAGNEPDFQTPWIYNWTNAPYKTSEVIRRIIHEQYSNRDNGLPGNDDLGAMGAFYVFANIGLFPEIPGYGGFSVNSPSFPDIKIHLAKGIITIKGGDESKKYINTLKLNGKLYNSTWVSWKAVENGATLDFNLSGKPNKNFGVSIEPPSFDIEGVPGWALGPFVRLVNANPVISPNPGSVFIDPMTNKKIAWEANDVFNPAATIKDNKIHVLYRAEDRSGSGIGERTSRLGIAESEDGIHMKRFAKPVFFPADDNQKEFEWTGGCEDPRIAVTEDGTYVMFYTQWNRKVPRLAVATSKDLVHWTKHGPAFYKAYDGKFKDLASKSASIVTEIKNNKQVIAKVNGKYMMYWGEKFVNIATSDDFINWQPMLDEKGELKAVIEPRAGYFDSELTECGPPAVLTENGIVLVYNGKNKEGDEGDKNYTTGTYAAGQVLFDSNNPAKVIDRLDKPFFVPSESFEKSGQYPAGTVFTEGLVYFKQKWFLYYGCADSRVAVAVYAPGKAFK